MDDPNTTNSSGTLDDPNTATGALEAKEDILTYTVADEVIEAAAGMEACSTIYTVRGLPC
jgi:hypothetical protein